jgi:[glutamine synthetase] adenylyltransferase / [glutamine synthetase]-adenylyl-L-tyrosine phosphorylase
MEQTQFEEPLRGLAERVGQRLGDHALAAATLQSVREHAPDEQLALAFLLQLGENSCEVLGAALRDEARRRALVFSLGGSELIATELRALGGNWVSAFDRARSVTGISEEEPSPDGLATPEALGTFKRRRLLAIGIADLLGRFSVAQTVAAMSDLAVQCIRAALSIAVRESDAGEIAQHFCVVAMGKLGAYELNLNSDIDLVYLFDAEEDLAQLAKAQRLGGRLTEILSTHCFRVDLRLRPGGRSAPLVSPFDGTLSFYQNFGETWERAALLRARPVAGAVGAGERLLSELQRFVYRVYLDFDTVRELRAMKQLIERELRSPDLVKRNVKLGYGGIRELEFIVQALALIYGGRDPRLRTPNTIAALERLENCGYMRAARARALGTAYLFLRNVEHKLQVAAGMQTHTLPADPRGLRILAARLGYGKGADAADRFIADLDARRAMVAEHFRQMLREDESDQPAMASDLAQAAWRATSSQGGAAELLTKMGFVHPGESAAELARLAQGSARPPVSRRRREALERLGPKLLDEMRDLADPDLALLNLTAFVSAVGERTSYLALLEERPATRQVLLRLFGSSAYLATLFIRHPEMIDTLVRSDLALARHSADELAAELRALVAACDGLEARLDVLRTFRQQEFLRIAIADLAGKLELHEMQAELTQLAETVLREALELAYREVETRHSIPADLKLSIMAMGRLGAREMAYNSDLDLIFVYFLPGEVAAGGREAASRVAQKLIAILEAPTREGYAYKIDLRLRPSGNAGPLVASLAGFHTYHQQSSALWERQALVRGRVVAGDPTLADEVEAARHKFVFGRGLETADVDEIATMRARIERELGHESAAQLNLKQGVGGTVDVEFLTQMMALRYGRTYPALRYRGTTALLRGIAQHDLMPAPAIASLEDDYRFLTTLENRLRIASDHAVSALPTALAALTPLARRAGYTGADAARSLLRDLKVRRRRVRAAFERCFARERAK